MNSFKTIPNVNSVEVFNLEGRAFIVATGEVDSEGWTDVLLMGAHYPNEEPTDGVWKFYLVAAKPEVPTAARGSMVRAFALGPEISKITAIKVIATLGEMLFPVDKSASHSSPPEAHVRDYVHRLQFTSGGVGRFTDN